MPFIALIVVIIFAAPVALLGSLIYLKFKADERRHQLAMQSQQSQSHHVETLQTELHQLRDTSTQFDVSLQHSLDRIEQRLEHLERRMNNLSDAKIDPVQQVIGR